MSALSRSSSLEEGRQPSSGVLQRPPASFAELMQSTNDESKRSIPRVWGSVLCFVSPGLRCRRAVSMHFCLLPFFCIPSPSSLNRFRLSCVHTRRVAEGQDREVFSGLTTLFAYASRIARMLPPLLLFPSCPVFLFFQGRRPRRKFVRLSASVLPFSLFLPRASVSAEADRLALSPQEGFIGLDTAKTLRRPLRGIQRRRALRRLSRMRLKSLVANGHQSVLGGGDALAEEEGLGGGRRRRRSPTSELSRLLPSVEQIRKSKILRMARAASIQQAKKKGKKTFTWKEAMQKWRKWAKKHKDYAG